MEPAWSPLSDREVLALYEALDACRSAWADHDAWRAALRRAIEDLTGGSVAAVGVIGTGSRGAASAPLPCRCAEPPCASEEPDASEGVAARAGVRRVVCAGRPGCPLVRLAGEDHGPLGLVGLAASRALPGDPGTTVTALAAAPWPLAAGAAHLLALLVQELAPRLGVELALAHQVGVHGLAPRARETLQQLLLGQSEKELACALRICASTAHEYVSAVYRHFEVQSRAELLSYFVRRAPKARGRIVRRPLRPPRPA